MRDAVMMAQLEDVANEQPKNWSLSQLDFVKELPRIQNVAAVKAAKTDLDTAMNSVVTSFTTLLKKDQEAFEEFLKKLTSEERNQESETHTNKRKHKKRGMDAAESVISLSVTLEVRQKGAEGLRAYQSTFTEIHKAMLPKSPHPPGIISIVDCSLMGDQLETCLSHTASILLTNKETAIALVLFPWDDNRSLGTEYKTVGSRNSSYSK